MKKSSYRSRRSTFENPIRVKLIELISDGINTVNDLAEVLDINRINLYHHLNTLEKERVIKGSFKGSRIKTFTIIEDSKNHLKDPEKITVIPNETNRDQITALVKKILELSGGEVLDSSSTVVQVDIIPEKSEKLRKQMIKTSNILSKKRKRP